MSFDPLVEEHHKLQFKSNSMLALQRYGPKLRPHVTEVPCVGEGAVGADLFHAVKYSRRHGRQRSNIENPARRSRRWLIYRDPIWTGEYLDSPDKFRTIESPDSELMRIHTAAIGRGIDDIILGIDEDGNIDMGGLLGPVVAGKRPGGAGVALPSKNITVHGGVGLSIAKLRGARKRLGLDENDLDRMTPVMAITTGQHDDLLGIVESASANLNMLEQPSIVNGKVTRLMGFTFVEMNGLPLKGAVRSCPVWIKDMVKLGVWQDIKPVIYNDSSAGNTPYIQVDAVMDATRVEDDGVHIIEATES